MWTVDHRRKQPTFHMFSIEVSDYREELMVSLSSARNLALKTIQGAQAKYKKAYDKNARGDRIRTGSWVMVYFPHEESGRNRKLCMDPTVSSHGGIPTYFPDHRKVTIHLQCVCPCPSEFPAGYFWYGSGRKGPGSHQDGSTGSYRRG